MINQSGLELLERIVRSCIPTFSNGGMEGKKYLASLVWKGEPVRFDDLLRGITKENMPVKKYDLYVHIHEEAKKQETKDIGKDFLMNFFACHPHIDRAAFDIKEEGVAEVMGGEYAIKDYVSHVLLPLTVTEIGDGFVCAKYENRDISFDVKNLVPIPEEKAFIKPGIPVLSHYASIVSTDISVFEMGTLLKMQTTHDGFMEACEMVSKKGIDHAKMMHFPWAKKIASV
jgi:hypothetical protein